MSRSPLPAFNWRPHRRARSFFGCAAIALLVLASARAETAAGRRAINYSGPIIDVHLHTEPPASARGVPNPVTGAPAANTNIELLNATLRECETYNVVRGVLNASPGSSEAWVRASPKRFLFAPMVLNQGPRPVIDTDTLRKMIESREAVALGEILSQYVGLKPDDPVLAPYWQLAEELDVPVMIHTGTSFPGTARAGYPGFRLVLGNPLLLEEVLVRHPKLRIWIAHGGLPWANETLALMQQYPQVYMDISTICWLGGAKARPSFHEFLEGAIARGMGKRILFGSDQMAWPDAIGLAVEGVDSAPFLNDEQKRDIFYANAVRFFRFTEPLE